MNKDEPKKIDPRELLPVDRKGLGEPPKPKVKPEDDETKEVPIEKPKEEPKKEVQVVPKGTKVDLTKEPKWAPKEKSKEEALKGISSEMWEDLFRAVLKDRLVRIERMLEWLIVQRVTDDQKLIKQPNIADIFKEIASKMDDKKTEGGG